MSVISGTYVSRKVCVSNRNGNLHEDTTLAVPACMSDHGYEFEPTTLNGADPYNNRGEGICYRLEVPEIEGSADSDAEVCTGIVHYPRCRGLVINLV